MKANILELARMCHYAQEHVECFDPGHREACLEPQSFVVACYFSDELDDGVEWEIVHEELCGPPLSVDEWEKVLKSKLKELKSFDGDYFK